MPTLTFFPELRIVVIAMLLLAAGLFLAKIIVAEQFRKNQVLYLEPKFAGWYSRTVVKSPQFSRFRPLMKLSNLLTTCMWISLVLAIGLAWMGQNLLSK
jgi:type II secretory pathway component PulF